MLTTFIFLSLVISRQINQPLRKVSSWVQKIAKGDSANCEIINTSFEFNNLSQSVITLNKRQLQYKEYQEQQLWLEHSISGLYKEMNGIMNLGELCCKVTGYLARLINSPAAAMYLVDKNYTLSLKGQYGCSSKGDYLEILQHDDGSLLIEAVKHKESIEISELPGNFFRIESAHLDKKPDTVYIIPFCYGARVKGLLAFACLTKPEKKYKQLLANTASPLANAIHSLELAISGNISAIDLTNIS
ncbi:GAF domain-containing protein [Endozoicomonas sp. Mp262]|uniref:GAF domain-containing protein n=1 Tax=Endozoicomonas sp. Mp262 TaxID=2919499 RepID=UPI0021D8EB33